MNITIIRLKDIIKYLICFILIISIISIGINLLNKEEFEEELEETRSGFLEYIKNSSFLYCLKSELPLISISEENETISSTKNILEEILGAEISIMGSLEEYEEIDNTDVEIKTNSEETQETNEEETQSTNIEVQENVETEVIAENNINATYTDTSNSVKINNQTSYDITDVLNNPSYEITNKNKVIIYHTHTCESYTSSNKYEYTMTGTYRTTDLNYTVARVGDELAKCLESYGKTVIHDITYHDYPAYNGSYGRSLTTMQNILADNTDAEIAIDLHRDAVRQ